MSSQFLKNQAFIKKLREPQVPDIDFNLQSTGFEEIFQLPEPKPQEELDRIRDVNFETAKPFLMDESIDFIEREEFANGGTFLDEKTFRELYKKFPGGTDAEFLEFVKKEGEAKGIKYTGQAGAELNPRSIQNRRQNVLKISKKGGLPFKLSPQEFRKRAKEYGINVRGLTDPFELMYNAQNDLEALQDDMQELLASVVSFDEATGEFDVSGAARRQLIRFWHSSENINLG